MTATFKELIEGIRNRRVTDPAQALANLLSGALWTFTTDPTITNATPRLILIETGATANEGQWALRADADLFRVQTMDDSGLNPITALYINRSGTQPTALVLPQDNEELQIGGGLDLRLYHDGTNSNIRNDTGALQFLFGATRRIAFGSTGGAGASTYIELSDSTPTAKAYIAVANAAGDITANSLAGDLVIRAQTEQILFTTDGGSTNILTLNASRADFTLPIQLRGYTVATLPAGGQGDTAFVTDALAPTFLTAVAGGGAVVTPVFYNGTNWVSY